MKKIIVAFLSFFVITSVSAESYKTVIFNMNDKYDISATYRICSYDSQNKRSCGDNNTILIKAKKSPADQNFIVIKQDQIPGSEIKSTTLEMMSSVEKDEMGTIVAEEKYRDDNRNLLGTCSGVLYRSDTQSSSIPLVGDSELTLNDMHQSPFIVCNYSYFAAL
jgi:hypothetical protein